MDERGPRLMPAMPIFQKHCFLKKGPKNQQDLKNPQIFFCTSGSIFIGHFNGTLFVSVMSLVGEGQKEMFLP